MVSPTLPKLKHRIFATCVDFNFEKCQKGTSDLKSEILPIFTLEIIKHQPESAEDQHQHAKQPHTFKFLCYA